MGRLVGRSWWAIWWTVIWGWIALSAAQTLGQSGNEGKIPAYDVVTIRPSLPGGWRGDTDTNADSYLAHNATLKAMLEDAYGIRQHLISGVPRPLLEARFEVQAKVVDPETIHSLKDEQRPAMLLQVLEDRFRLKAHVEMKVLPVYDLVVARGGPKFKEATKESLENEDMEVRRRMLTATAQTMPDLANALTGVLNRSVLDETGLPGRYDFALRWTPDGSDAAADVMAPPRIFDALEGQLGLRLRPGRGEVKALVVDEAEMPGEN